jgi:hypothetical protein
MKIADRKPRFVSVRRTFAWFVDDYHRDGIVGVSAKVLPDDNAALVAALQSKFYMPAYRASRGWQRHRRDTCSVD